MLGRVQPGFGGPALWWGDVSAGFERTAQLLEAARCGQTWTGPFPTGTPALVSFLD